MADTAEVELKFNIVPYVKQEPYNEFTPFVEAHLAKLPADKSIVISDIATEDDAKAMLSKIQKACYGTAVSARKRALYADKETGKWVLEIGQAPRAERKPLTAK